MWIQLRMVSSVIQCSARDLFSAGPGKSRMRRRGGGEGKGGKEEEGRRGKKRKERQMERYPRSPAAPAPAVRLPRQLGM